MDINLLGTTLVAVSADKSIKIYELTKEPTILEDEQQKKFDNQIQDELSKDINMQTNSVNMLNSNISNLVPIKKSLENLTFSEELCDAIDLCDKFREEVYQYEIACTEYESNLEKVKSNQHQSVKFFNMDEPTKPSTPIELSVFKKNIFEFMMQKLKKISPLSELENTLNNLAYPYVQKLLFYLEYQIRNKLEVELSARCLVFLLKLYEVQFSNDKTLVRTFLSIKSHMREALQEIKNIVNFNYYSISCLERLFLLQKEDNDFMQS